MSHEVWRIATDTPRYLAEDLSGKGAEATGGRWNEKGVPVVYASETRALACLETIVHLNAGGLPLNRYLVSIEIPDAVWARAVRHTSPPVGWEAEPAAMVSIQFGTKWLASNSSALLIVPSVIVHEEYNVLVNPSHADSKGLKATKIRRWTYDPRLTKPP